MDYHPIANAFPLIEGDEFTQLVNDIREHGLLEPIIAYEGLILDGRNRERACMEAGVAPRYRVWDGEGGSPSAFVWSKNMQRRHLNAAQKAFAAAILLPQLREEAKERQGARTDLDNFVPKSERSEPGRAVVQAGRLVGVGKGYVQAARKMLDKAEHDEQTAHAVEEVKAGRMSMNKALQVAGVESRLGGKGKKPARSEPQPQPEATTPSDSDEYAASLRRSRSLLSPIATPPAEGANEAAKARFASRPVRVLADYLNGLRLEMEREGLTLTDEALTAWWEGIEPREWEQIQASVTWFSDACEPLLKFIRYKMTRKSIPPMVAVIQKQSRRNGR